MSRYLARGVAGAAVTCPSESVWEGFRLQVTLWYETFPSDFLSQKLPPTPLNRPAFGKKGKGHFTMLMSSSAPVRLQPPDTKPEEPRQIPRQTMLFPSPPHITVGLAQPPPGIYMGLCEGGASFLGLTWDGWAWDPGCCFPAHLHQVGPSQGLASYRF